jgi:GTPase SAR1 family protein
MRLVTLGDSNVGKTTLVCQLVEQRPTGLALERSRMQVPLPNGTTVSVDLWDASANEIVQHFVDDDAVWQSYTRDLKGVVLLYTDRSMTEIDNVRKWLQELRKRDSALMILLVLNRVAGIEERNHLHMLQNLAREYRCLHASSNVAHDQTSCRGYVHGLVYVLHYRDVLQTLQPTTAATTPDPAARDAWESDVPKHSCNCVLQ